MLSQHIGTKLVKTLDKVVFLRPTSPSGFERHEELYDVVDDLHTTEDGEAGDEPHSAANEAKLGLQGHLHISLYLVIGSCVKVDMIQL